MRKKILCILFVSLALLLAACGVSGSDESIESLSPEVTVTPTPEPTREVILTGNAFLDAEIQIARVGNGYRAYIEISKEDAINTSMEEYLEFLSQRVENSIYNWWTVCFDDGTGLVYTGSLTYAVEYGIIDASDGTMAYGYGFLKPEDDGTYTYHDYEDDNADELSSNVIDEASNKLLITLVDTVLSSDDYDNTYTVAVRGNTVIVTYWVNGLGDAISIYQAAGYGADYEGWVSVKDAIVVWANSIYSMIQAAEWEGWADIGLTFNVVNDLNHDDILLSVHNSTVVYDVLDR